MFAQGEQPISVEIKENKNHDLNISVAYRHCDPKEFSADKLFFPHKSIKKYTNEKDPRTGQVKQVVIDTSQVEYEYRAYPLVTKDGYFLFKIRYGWEDHDVIELEIARYFKTDDCYLPHAIKFKNVANESEAGEVADGFISNDEGIFALKTEGDNDAENYEFYNLKTLKKIKTVPGDKFESMVQAKKFVGLFGWLRLKGNFPWSGEASTEELAVNIVHDGDPDWITFFD